MTPYKNITVANTLSILCRFFVKLCGNGYDMAQEARKFCLLRKRWRISGCSNLGERHLQIISKVGKHICAGGAVAAKGKLESKSG